VKSQSVKVERFGIHGELSLALTLSEGLPKMALIMKKHLGLCVGLLTLTAGLSLAAGPVTSVRVVLPDNAGAITRRAATILGRQITFKPMPTRTFLVSH
jgi:hypothetical protein